MLQPPAFQKGTAPGLAGALQEASRAHEEMDKRVANLQRLLQELGLAMDRHHSRVTTMLAHASANPERSKIAELLQMQSAFKAQYLELQARMQHENRSYTTVSNVMKTKHDTAKNSISNVR